MPPIEPTLLNRRPFSRRFAAVGRRKEAFLIVVAALCVGCQEERTEPPPPPIRPVVYQTVEAVGGVRERTFSAVAKAGVESRISFKVGGTIRELHPQVGDRLRKGQLIAKLDPRDYELRVEETQASLAQARAQAVRAEADFARIRGLFERDNASQAEYDAARAARDSAQAQVRSIEKKLETAKLQLEYTTLTSPIDGAVAEVPVEVNENVQAGRPIVVLNSGALPEVEVAIPEILIREIRQGQVVQVRFDAIPDRSFPARVTEVGIAPTQGLTTFPVTVRLTYEDPRILPGMAAEVTFRIATGNQRPLFVVPPHVVLEDRQGRFVYVVTPKGNGLGSVQRRPVVVGKLVGGGLEILDGLQDGEFVVTAGVSRLTDGEQVQLRSEYKG